MLTSHLEFSAHGQFRGKPFLDPPSKWIRGCDLLFFRPSVFFFRGLQFFFCERSRSTCLLSDASVSGFSVPAGFSLSILAFLLVEFFCSDRSDQSLSFSTLFSLFVRQGTTIGLFLPPRGWRGDFRLLFELRPLLKVGFDN